MFRRVSCEKNEWYKQALRYIDSSIDLVISDSVPQLSSITKELGIKHINVQHFTWDWLYMSIYGKDDIYNELNKCYKDWGEFIFPPLTPVDNLNIYPEHIPIDFIVNRQLIRQSNSTRIQPNDKLKNILLMNNGTQSLTAVIQNIIEYLPFNNGWNILVRSDNLSESAREIALERNDIKILHGLTNVHLAIANSDIVVARGGYNILSELLALRKEAIIIEEKNNPEIISNLKLASKYKIMNITNRENAIASLQNLIIEKSKTATNEVLKYAVSSLGACQVVLKILEFSNI